MFNLKIKWLIINIPKGKNEIAAIVKTIVDIAAMQQAKRCRQA